MLASTKVFHLHFISLMCQTVWIKVCFSSGAPCPSILIVEVHGIVFPYTMSMTFQFKSLLTYILYKTTKPCMNECSNTAILLCIIITICMIIINAIQERVSHKHTEHPQETGTLISRVTSTNLWSPEENYICTYNLILHNMSEQVVNSALKRVKTKYMHPPVRVRA